MNVKPVCVDIATTTKKQKAQSLFINLYNITNIGTTVPRGNLKKEINNS